MGKFIKICLIVGVICVAAGILTSGTGIFKGGLTQLKEEILNGEWSIELGENAGMKPFFELEEQHYFKEDALVNVDMEKVQDTFSEADVQELHIKSAGVTVELAEHEGEGIFIEANKVHKYQAYLEAGELHIIARGQSTPNLGKGEVKVSVPSSFCNSGIADVEIESAASVVIFDKLAAKDVELKVSAGTISWKELTAGELSVEMAAGTVNGTNTNVTGETDMKVSAGTITLTGVLGSETELETTAGKVEITLGDAFKAYNYDISCAGGSVTVGDQAVEGIAKTIELEHGAMKHIDVECSVGAVNISFAEE